MIKLNFAKNFSASVIAISAATMISTSAMAADIVDTAVQAGTFKTLAAALGAAGLVDTLKSPGPFTVFAPTDEAFAKLPAGTVEELLKPENKKKLVAINSPTWPPAFTVLSCAVCVNNENNTSTAKAKIKIKPPSITCFVKR